jgi:hypothetical protein
MVIGYPGLKLAICCLGVLAMLICFWVTGTGIVRMGASGVCDANSGGAAKLTVRWVLFFANGRDLPEQPARTRAVVPMQIVSRQAERKYLMCVT